MKRWICWTTGAVLLLGVAAVGALTYHRAQKHTHSFFEIVSAAPTCETDGEKAFACECGKIKERAYEAVGHAFVSYERKTPTCVESGYAAYEVCERCGYTTKTEISATGVHSWNKGVQVGDVWKYTCTTCGEIQTKIVEGHTHVFDDGKITRQPTCAEEGVKTYTCACGESWVETIEKTTAHTPETVQGSAASCITNGKTDGEKCSVCGIWLKEQQTVYGAHSIDVLQGRAPTCKQEGVSEGLRCIVCGMYTKMQTTIEKLPHSWNDGEAIAGAAQVKYTCLSCGETRLENVEGHTHVFDEWSEKRKSTCLETGLKVGACICGETVEESIPALGHVGGEATCLDDGLCGRCGAVVESALGHTGGEATCLTGEICTRCGVEYGVAVDCAGGTATCLSAPVCKWCDEPYNKALGHSYENDVCTRCGAKQPALGAELDYVWNAEKGYYICTGVKNADEVCRKVIVPDAYEGKPVGEIAAQAFYRIYTLTSVEIGENVEKIGLGAFLNCFNLFEVVIYSEAISGKKNDISNNGHLAYYARSVDTVAGENKIFEDDEGFVTYKDGESCVLIGYTGVETKLVLPNGITEVNAYVFSTCAGLTEVTLSNSVQVVRERAFSDCATLKKVTLGTGVKTIEVRAFSNVTALKEVVFSKTMGWWYKDFEISARALGDAELAAALLTVEYTETSWERKDE